MATHKPGYVFLLVLLWLVFIASIIFMTFAAFDDSVFKTGLFDRTLASALNRYPSPLMAADWTYYIWPSIYAYQLIWLIYVTTTYVRVDDEDDYVYEAGPALPWPFYLLQFLAMGCHIAWLFLFTKGLLIPAVGVEAGHLLMEGLSLSTAVVALERHHAALPKLGLSAEPGLMIGMVHNGVGLRVGWLVVSLLQNLALVLINTDGIRFISDLAFTTSLGSLTAFTALGVALDMGVGRRSTRWLLDPYVGAAFGLSGIIVKNFNNRNILTLGLASGLGLVLIVKVIKGIVEEARERKSPEEDEEEDYSSLESETS